jgi:hypothetical protein
MTHWLLQCNHDRYDTNNLDWLTRWSFFKKGLAAKLHPGDQVVIWLSGKAAGVYATAEVAEGEPYEDQTDTGFKRAEDIGRLFWSVHLLDGQPLGRPVLKPTLKADPRFAHAQILRNPRQANPFRVSDEEWEAISSRI